MNSKIDAQIIDFMNEVGWYISMEYGTTINNKYIKEWHNTEIFNSLYDFVGSYYMGGNTVPDTARYVVEYIESFVWEKK